MFAVKVQTETRQSGTLERNQIISSVTKAGQFHGPGSRQILKKDERTYIHTRSGQLRHLSEGVQVDTVELIGEKIPAKLDQRRKHKLCVEGIIRFLKRNNSKYISLISEELIHRATNFQLDQQLKNFAIG